MVKNRNLLLSLLKINAMLLSFKIKNFLSYKDENQILMTSIKSFKELQKNNIFKEREFDILKTSAIYLSLIHI